MALIRNFIIGGTEQKKKDEVAAVRQKREQIKAEITGYAKDVADQLGRALILGLCGALILFPIVSAVVFALKF